MHRTKRSGFTLVELLISIVIITITISLANLVYANYVRMDEKFTNKSKYYAELPEMTDQIRLEVKQSKDAGELKIDLLNCNWNVSNKIEDSAKSFDLNIGREVKGDITYILNTVDINCSIKESVFTPYQIKVLTLEHASKVFIG